MVSISRVVVKTKILALAVPPEIGHILPPPPTECETHTLNLWYYMQNKGETREPHFGQFKENYCKC